MIYFNQYINISKYLLSGRLLIINGFERKYAKLNLKILIIFHNIRKYYLQLPINNNSFKLKNKLIN